MRTIIFLIFSFLLTTVISKAQSDNDLKHRPEGKSPEEIGKRIAVKFINTSYLLR